MHRLLIRLLTVTILATNHIMKRPSDSCSKSLKRLKFENEIFSKSIEDIELMFISSEVTYDLKYSKAFENPKSLSSSPNFKMSYMQRKHSQSPSDNSSRSKNSLVAEFSSQYLPSSSTVASSYNYDCIDLSLLDPKLHTKSKRTNIASKSKPGILRQSPNYSIRPRDSGILKVSAPILPSQNRQLDYLDFDDDYEDLGQRDLEYDLRGIDTLLGIQSEAMQLC